MLIWDIKENKQAFGVYINSDGLFVETYPETQGTMGGDWDDWCIKDEICEEQERYKLS